MNWLGLAIRMILGVISILAILWGAESVVPFGSVLVLIVLVGVIGTACILYTVRDTKRLPRFFD